jgi:hypothetical protein
MGMVYPLLQCIGHTDSVSNVGTASCYSIVTISPSGSDLETRSMDVIFVMQTKVLGRLLIASRSHSLSFSYTQ